jgi:vacuolar iron transporter family protein
MAKGFRGDDLTRVANKITSDKDVWLKTMSTEELGLEIVRSPIKSVLEERKTKKKMLLPR